MFCYLSWSRCKYLRQKELLIAPETSVEKYLAMGQHGIIGYASAIADVYTIIAVGSIGTAIFHSYYNISGSVASEVGMTACASSVYVALRIYRYVPYAVAANVLWSYYNNNLWYLKL